MTKFRPCIDLHDGQVKQIVGSSLADLTTESESSVTRPPVHENHVAEEPAEWFAAKYARDGLEGGHVIKLGPGNDAAARSALEEFPGGLQLGGGVNADNATSWIDAGASHVIVTSCLFDGQGRFQQDQLDAFVRSIGKSRIVIDLSCKRTEGGWTVAMNRWQTLTNLDVTAETLNLLSEYCDEFLIHAADVEGLCQGIDQPLVELLGKWRGLPMTYAGGVATIQDVQLVDSLSQGGIDVTVGSALDLFGGKGVRYAELLDWNRRPETDLV